MSNFVRSVARLFSRPLVAGFALYGGIALAAPSALDTIKQRNAEVDRLLRQKVEKGTPAEQKVKDDLRRLAGALLDYSELSKKALGPQWEKLSPAQQKEFVAVFQKLIERHYVKQLRTNLDYEVNWRGEQIDGATATVTSVIKVKTSSGTTDAQILYKLKKGDAGWQVWDVVTDEMSLVRNYNSQFAKIITTKGYDELLRRMKQKAEDPSDAVTAAKGAGKDGG